MKRDLLLTLYSTHFLCIKYKTSKQTKRNN